MVKGTFGNGLKFEGKGAYVDIPPNPKLERPLAR